MTLLIVLLGIAALLICLLVMLDERSRRPVIGEPSPVPPTPEPRITVTETRIIPKHDLEDSHPVVARLRRGLLIEVTGESRVNEDGTERQDILSEASEGDIAELEREPENDYDENAIRVDLAGGTVGYVNRALAAELAPAMDAGVELDVAVSRIAGGTTDKPSFGVWLRAYLK